jgi:predicted dehydrogenase
LLAANAVELAFVFGRHAEMPRLAETLIRRHIPFSIEKPCGRTAEEVRRLREYAAAEGVFVAVPLWSRISDLLAEIRVLGEGGGATRFDHIAIRFIAGPPSRYEAAGAAWMLDPEVAGGGCLINLAAHLIDLCLLMLGADVAHVHGRSSHRGFGAAVEDYFLLLMATADGGVATVETGYTFPMTDTEQREFSFSMSSATHYVRSTADGIRIYERLRRAPAREKKIRLDADVYYSPYVERVVSDLRRGAQPVAGLREAEAVMRGGVSPIGAGKAAGGIVSRIERIGAQKAVS